MKLPKNSLKSKRHPIFPLSISDGFKTLVALYFIIGSIIFSNIIISENKPSFYNNAYAYPSLNGQKNFTSYTKPISSTIEPQIPQHIQNEWISKRDNIKIISSSDPLKIITDKNINLRFDVLNLTTGQYVKNFDSKVTMISNNENLFKFESLSNNKGYLIINHTFSDPGVTQIFLRIDKPSQFVSTAAEFSIITMPNGNNLINSLPISIVFTIIGLIVILTLTRKLKINEVVSISKKKDYNKI